jgi:predicted alpha/beta superfamily hydrolase
MNIKKILWTVVSLTLANSTLAQNGTKENVAHPLSNGEKIEFLSEILNEQRTFNIYLPNGYSIDSSKLYPIIYLLDGSMDEDFIHISGIVQFGSFSWINMLPESIVVGIANIDRKRDFTFQTNNKKDKEDYPTTGSSANFMNFLEKELQPFIDAKYKTNSVKTLIGQSLGGLLATEILFKKSDLFDNYIIASPSLWWDDESLLKLKPVNYSTRKSIYIAVGKEGEVMERTAKELYDKLKLQKADRTNLYFEFFEKQNHGDVIHLAVYNAFEKMFSEIE